MNLYCIRYDFSAALISALALLKYATLGLTVVFQKEIGDLPTGGSHLRNAYYVITFCCFTHVFDESACKQLTVALSQATNLPGLIIHWAI